HAVLHLGEGEAALLLDDALLGYPSDLVRTPPAVQPQHAGQWEAQRDHLNLIASANPLGLLTDRLPPGDPFDDGGDVPMVGEVVKSTLGRGFGSDLCRELALGHFPKQVSLFGASTEMPGAAL